MSTYVPWDGEAPLFEWQSEKTITSEEDLIAFLEGAQLAGKSLDQITTLCICQPDNGPNFCIMDYLEDSVCPSYEFDPESVKAINAQVNAWIDANAPYGLDTTGKYADPESLRKWWPESSSE